MKRLWVLRRADLAAPSAGARPRRHRARLALTIDVEVDRLVEETDEMPHGRRVVTRLAIGPGDVLEHVLAESDREVRCLFFVGTVGAQFAWFQLGHDVLAREVPPGWKPGLE